MSTKPILTVTIKTAESVVFEGNAQSLSSRNETGAFDVLPLHENFICIIQDSFIVTKEGGEKQIFPIKSKGILRVETNKATVFFGVEVIS